MDFMDFSRRLDRWASEGVDMYVLYLCLSVVIECGLTLMKSLMDTCLLHFSCH